MSEHTQRRQRREERWEREKEGKQDRFLKGARTLVLKWEHDDRTLHPRVSRPRAGQGWGGSVSKQPRGHHRDMARAPPCSAWQLPAGTSRSRSPAVEPQQRYPRIPSQSSQRGCPQRARRFRDCTGWRAKGRCTAAACRLPGVAAKGGRQGPATQLLAVTSGVEAQEQSCDTTVSECLAFPPSEKRYRRSDPTTCKNGTEWGPARPKSAPYWPKASWQRPCA